VTNSQKYKIGIDPGTKTGYALVVDSKLVEIETVDFWRVYHLITDRFQTDICEIHIEDTSDTTVWHTAKNIGQMKRIGINVGKVIREAELLILGLKWLGYRVVPHREKKSRKIDAKTFQKITGWTGRTSQHGRDAAMMIL
jgi:hypothetical protein